jgi:hypothetical protein
LHKKQKPEYFLLQLLKYMAIHKSVLNLKHIGDMSILWELDHAMIKVKELLRLYSLNIIESKMLILESQESSILMDQDLMNLTVELLAILSVKLLEMIPLLFMEMDLKQEASAIFKIRLMD